MSTEWPKHPDGSNMLIGEMAAEVAKTLIAEASARSRAKVRSDQRMSDAFQAIHGEAAPPFMDPGWSA